MVQGPQVYILKAQIGTTPAAKIHSAGLGQPGGPVHWVSAYRGGRRPRGQGQPGSSSRRIASCVAPALDTESRDSATNSEGSLKVSGLQSPYG